MDSEVFEQIEIKDIMPLKIRGLCYKEKLAAFDIYYDNRVHAPDVLERYAPRRMNAYSFIIVHTGSARLYINYKVYEAKKGDLILLTPYHLSQLLMLSENLIFRHLLVLPSFFNTLPLLPFDSREMLWLMSPVHEPIISLEEAEAGKLAEKMGELSQTIISPASKFHERIVEHQTTGVVLEILKNIKQGNLSGEPGPFLSRKEAVFKEFMRLVYTHFREEHSLAYYASHLNVSPPYLIRIVKQFSGRGVNVLINDMLFSEAIIQLRRPELSIQQVAENLNFADSSSFGKFFKRISGGITPLNYRKKRLV